MLTGLWRSDGLYNLRADPAENENLILVEPERAGEMAAHLEGYPGISDWRTCAVDVEEAAPISDRERKAMEETLRSLGYIE